MSDEDEAENLFDEDEPPDIFPPGSDGGAASSSGQPKRRRVDADVISIDEDVVSIADAPDGPKTFSDVISANCLTMSDILCGHNIPADEVDKVKERFQKWAERRRVLTNTYGGIITDMYVDKQVERCIRAHMPDIGDSSVVLYSTTESAPLPCNMVQVHAQCPTHSFGDVRCRLYEWDRKSLEDTEDQMLESYTALQDELALKNVTDKQFAEESKVLGASYFDALCDYLGGVQFQEYVDCSTHNCKCPVSPRIGLKGTPFEYAMWEESAGVTCVAWSTNVSKKSPGFLHRSTLTMLTWAFSIRFYEADTIVMECVQRLPIQKIATAVFEQKQRGY